MVTRVFPTSSGTDAVHAAVPDATPASPFDVLHRTEAALDAAVPLTVRLAAVVATIVVAGAVIVSAGGVPAGEGVGAGFDGGAVGGVAGGLEGGLDGGFDGVPPVPSPAAPYRFCTPAISSDVSPVDVR